MIAVFLANGLRFSRSPGENFINFNWEIIMKVVGSLTCARCHIEYRDMATDNTADHTGWICDSCIADQQGLSAGNAGADTVCEKLGTATTIGELKKLIENFDDNISFGFRNQPMQDLYKIDYEDFTAIVFQ